MQDKKKILKEFQKIPGVGKEIANDLWRLGIYNIKDLRSCDPEALYEKLCKLQEKKVDRCMLYVFRCAIYFVNSSDPDPELSKWWNWKDGKKIYK